jgi:DNA-binding transcriptional regulator YiaG
MKRTPTRSSLREALERREPVRGIARARSGTAANYLLTPLGDIAAPVSVASILVRHGLALRQAHRVVGRLAAGRSVALRLPKVDNAERFASELRRAGVDAARREQPRRVDVKRIRQRLGLSQAEFAARFCLEEATVRNWEQGRNTPEGPARTLLAIIAESPETIDEILSR